MVGLIIIAIIIALIVYLAGRDKQTPKRPPPKTPDRVASDGGVYRPVQDRSAFGLPSPKKNSLRQVTRAAHKTTAIRSPAIDNPALHSKSVKPHMKRPTDTEWAAATRALKDHDLPAEILADPMAEGYSRMLDALSQRYPLIPFD
jgi:hypothetical protein